MISTLKFRSKAICRKIFSQSVVLPAAEPPATPTMIFWMGSSTRLLFLGLVIPLLMLLFQNY
jgi:hypothetical protein